MHTEQKRRVQHGWWFPRKLVDTQSIKYWDNQVLPVAIKNSPSHTKSVPTYAFPSIFAIPNRFCSLISVILITKVSPAMTGFLNLTLSTPAKKKFSREPPTSGCSITRPPTWAIASTMRTPGIMGLSGKCPGKKLSFMVTFFIPTADTPGLYSITLSTNKNGNLCGNISLIWLMSITVG